MICFRALKDSVYSYFNKMQKNANQSVLMEKLNGKIVYR